MKQISYIGRVVEIYRESPWSAYGHSVPPGHPAGEKPARIDLEVNGLLELAAILPPEAASGLQVGSIVKVILAPASEREVAEYDGAQRLA